MSSGTVTVSVRPSNVSAFAISSASRLASESEYFVL